MRSPSGGKSEPEGGQLAPRVRSPSGGTSEPDGGQLAPRVRSPSGGHLSLREDSWPLG